MKLVVDSSRQTSDQPDYMKKLHRLKQRVTSTRPEMDLENARILTRGFKESQGEPLVVQKARAFRLQCQKKDDQDMERRTYRGLFGKQNSRWNPLRRYLLVGAQ